MPKLLLTLEETVLTMNQFPGWVDDSEWINNFNKKAKDIDSLWLKYYFDSENLNIQNINGYAYIEEDLPNNNIFVSKENLVEGVYQAVIDKGAKSALLTVGGVFEIDAEFMEKNEIKGLRKCKCVFAHLFKFTDAKGNMTKAEGCFTNSWETYVKINVSVK